MRKVCDSSQGLESVVDAVDGEGKSQRVSIIVTQLKVELYSASNPQIAPLLLTIMVNSACGADDADYPPNPAAENLVQS